MSDSKDASTTSGQPTDRRRFLTGAGIALGAGALTTLAGPATAAVTSGASLPKAPAGGYPSILDKVLDTKKISFGVDLGFAPLQYKTANGTPTGYIIELAKKLAASLGATPQWVEVPFANLFAAQAAGKFDMSGISATIKPERAQKVLFASAPSFVESNVVLLKPGYKLTSLSQLNSASVTLAVVVGSSQEAAAQILYPKAKLKRLTNQAAIADVAAGRSTAMILGEFSVAESLKAYPRLGVFKGKPVFVDENSFFMPADDFRMKAYVDTWLRYETSHNELAGLWDKYVGNAARRLGLQSVSISSEWSR